MRIQHSALYCAVWVSYCSALTFNCKDVVKEGITWNFEKLAGLHQVSWVRSENDIVKNTTFKIDICQALKLEDKAEKEHCRDGTRICAVYNTYTKDKPHYQGAWPIVREFVHDGASINPNYTRLKTDETEDKADRDEGVIAELGGGLLDKGDLGKQKQKARISFVCLRDKEKMSRSLLARRDDTEDKDTDNDEEKWKAAGQTDDGVGGRIEFEEYDEKVLELRWSTPFACEDAVSSPDKNRDPGSGGGGGGWGFFSWFFFLVFMLLFLFVAFTAWVNYTRNGYRGCDLLPFADTLRDLPYILGDWWRKIANTLGGSGTRGGYSAV